jgi:tetratricopeptide (TPR) repeat protein
MQDEFKDNLKNGTALLMQGKPAEALPHLQAAHQLSPDNTEAALNLGGAFIMAGKHKQAVPILEKLSEADADNAQVWTNLGAAYLGNPITATNERQIKSLHAFARALVLDPNARSVAYNMGLIYRDRNELDKAIASFKRALASDPNDKDARRILERLEMQMGSESKF